MKDGFSIPQEAVKNIRYGLATNSSSSHSIIHTPDAANRQDDLQNDEMSYQWEFFTLASKEEKRKYMAAQLMSSIPYETRQLVEQVLIDINEPTIAKHFEYSGVDHQSVINFPDSPTGGTAVEFYKEYSNYLVNEDFIILGGNDNSQDDHKLASLDDGVENYSQAIYQDDVAWKNGNYWVVINPRRKLRLNFDNEEPTAKIAELVDLKITDYCNLGCDFCYQGSTISGEHAPVKTVSSIISSIGVYGTRIEFAIGGGEPTQHPDFISILENIKHKGHIANFTTRSKVWFDDQDIVDAVMDNVSGIAYSVDTIEEVQEFHELHKKAFVVGHQSSKRPPVFYLHLIPELLGNDKFRELINAVDAINQVDEYTGYKINVTLLGYKAIGRAQGTTVPYLPEIIDIMLLTRYTSIGIDTKFAQVYQTYLDQNKISRKLYTTQEGQYSIYIDAIKELAYKSSYELDNPIDLVYEKYNRPHRKHAHEVFQEIQEIQT